MFTDEIKKKYFDSAKDPADAIYVQLRKGFLAWVNDSKQDTEFPSERELSAFFQVNRRTLRQALGPLLESGKLKRKGYKTFVNHQIGAYTKRFEAEQNGPVKPTIKFLLTECYPSHKEFWKRVFDGFNRLLPAHKVQPYFAAMPDGGNDSEFWERFEAEDFDLVNLPVSYHWIKGAEEHLLPVKDVTKAYFNTDEFLTGTITETADQLRDYAYPYMFTFMTAKYLKPYHIQDGKHVQELSFEDILRYAVKNVPLEFPFLNIYYDISRDLGALVKVTPENILEQCNTVLDRLDIVRERKNVFAVSRCNRGFLLNRADKLFCRQEFSVMNHDSNNKYELTVFPPREGSYFWGGCGSVGICRNSDYKQESLLFTEYLLSEPVQNLIWKYFCSAPVRVSSLQTVEGVSQERLLPFLRCCRENPRSYPAPVGCAMLPYFEQYLEGSLSRDKVIENVLRFYS